MLDSNSVCDFKPVGLILRLLPTNRHLLTLAMTWKHSSGSYLWYKGLGCFHLLNIKNNKDYEFIKGTISRSLLRREIPKLGLVTGTVWTTSFKFRSCCWHHRVTVIFLCICWTWRRLNQISFMFLKRDKGKTTRDWYLRVCWVWG